MLAPMTRTVPTAGSEYATARLRSLQSFHLPLQRVVFWLVGPLSTALYALPLFGEPTWHAWVLFFACVSLFAAWGVGLGLTLRGRLGLSLGIFVASVISFETLELCISRGTEGTAILGSVTVTIYAAMYSRRYLYLAAAGTMLGLVLSELLKYAEPFGLLVNPPAERLVTQAAFGILLTVVVVVLLRKNQQINDDLLGSLERTNADQGRLLRTAGRIQPVIDGAVDRIREVSEAVAAQAAEQSAAASEVGATVAGVRRGSSQSAAAAAETRRIAERTRDGALAGARRLEAVEQGFREALQLIEGARAVVVELAGRAESIESILGYNREIGEQIKILSINAAVQAAKAGEHGAAFRVVAAELRAMIGSTDRNLASSRELLDQIRAQARENAASIDAVAALLRRQFESLREVGAHVGRIAGSFAETSDRVVLIAEAAGRQDVAIDEVVVAVTQLGQAATDLEHSSRVLVEAVERIAKSQSELQGVLGAGR
jgi:methyl-accepting chemotaxis protein